MIIPLSYFGSCPIFGMDKTLKPSSSVFLCSQVPANACATHHQSTECLEEAMAIPDMVACLPGAPYSLPSIPISDIIIRYYSNQWYYVSVIIGKPDCSY